jgi:hypothetical protein
MAERSSRHIYPVTLFQADVEDGHMRRGQRDAGQGIGGCSRLSHDLNLVVALQQAADALADEIVIVQEEDADGHRHILPTNPAEGVR